MNLSAKLITSMAAEFLKDGDGAIIKQLNKRKIKQTHLIYATSSVA